MPSDFARLNPELWSDLIALKISLLGDAVGATGTAAVSQRLAPMAIFWDVETVRIPNHMTCLHVTECLKFRLAYFGLLHHEGFRVYTSFARDELSEEQRTVLQRCGRKIVDTSHQKGADKLIIVDAMSFAFEHHDGAALVIVTGAETNYAHLLARLNLNPKWRTVLVCSSRIKDVLHLNAHHCLRWSNIVNFPQPGALQVVGEVSPLSMSGSVAVAGPSREPGEPSGGSGNNSRDEQEFRSDLPEETEDDMAILLKIMLDLAAQDDPVPLKAKVGWMLKEMDPLRFGSKEARQALFNRALDEVTGCLKEAQLPNGHPVLRLVSNAAPDAKRDVQPELPWLPSRSSATRKPSSTPGFHTQVGTQVRRRARNDPAKPKTAAQVEPLQAVETRSSTNGSGAKASSEPATDSDS